MHSLAKKIPKQLRDNLENDKIIVLTGGPVDMLVIINVENGINKSINVRKDCIDFDLIDEKRAILIGPSRDNFFIIFDLETEKEIISIPNNIIKQKYLILKRSKDLEILFYNHQSYYIYNVNKETTTITKKISDIQVRKFLRYPGNNNKVLVMNSNNIEMIDLTTHEITVLKTIKDKLNTFFISKFHKNSLLITSFNAIYLLNLSDLSLKELFNYYGHNLGDHSIAIDNIIELSDSEVITMNYSSYLIKDWNKVTELKYGSIIYDLPTFKKFAIRGPDLMIYNYDNKNLATIEGDWRRAIEMPKNRDKLIPYIKEYIQETNYIPKDIANIIGKFL